MKLREGQLNWSSPWKCPSFVISISLKIIPVGCVPSLLRFWEGGGRVYHTPRYLTPLDTLTPGYPPPERTWDQRYPTPPPTRNMEPEIHYPREQIDRRL